MLLLLRKVPTNEHYKGKIWLGGIYFALDAGRVLESWVEYRFSGH